MCYLIEINLLTNVKIPIKKPFQLLETALKFNQLIDIAAPSSQ